MQGAQAIAAAGADLIIMDDGFQNPALVQDLRLVVLDGETGFGNGRAIPAGPLRERIQSGLSRADALVLVGADRHGVAAAGHQLPVLRACIEPRDAAWLAGAAVLGFAGIGRPEKFRVTLGEAGAKLTGFHAFTDHHPYTEHELGQLAREADKAGAALVTTEKDWVRLPKAWRARIRPVPVGIHWEDEAALASLLARIPAHV